MSLPVRFGNVSLISISDYKNLCGLSAQGCPDPAVSCDDLRFAARSREKHTKKPRRLLRTKWSLQPGFPLLRWRDCGKSSPGRYRCRCRQDCPGSTERAILFTTEFLNREEKHSLLAAGGVSGGSALAKGCSGTCIPRGLGGHRGTHLCYRQPSACRYRKPIKQARAAPKLGKLAP